MSIVAWILLGGAAGVAAYLLSGKRSFGLLSAAFLGVFGAAVAGFAFNTLAGREDGQLSLWSLFVSLLGAGAVLAISSAVAGRRVPEPVRIPPPSRRMRRYR